MKKILIIDDDQALGNLLKEYLESHDLIVDIEENPVNALEWLKTHQYALILLDVMMPQLDGFECLKRLRVFCDTPVIMVTAKGDAYDKVLGLELGADDYLAKPFNHRELLARIKSNTRRFDKTESILNNDTIHIDDLYLDNASLTASFKDLSLDFTATEFQLLYLLARNAGSKITKDQLNKAVLGRSRSAFDRSLDMHISNIRKKLAEVGCVNRIKTLRGQGYLLIH